MKNLVKFPVLTSEDMQLIYVLKCHLRTYSFCKNSLQYIFVRYTELQISFQESEMTHKHRAKHCILYIAFCACKCNGILKTGFIRRILPTS